VIFEKCFFSQKGPLFIPEREGKKYASGVRESITREGLALKGVWAQERKGEGLLGKRTRFGMPSTEWGFHEETV